MTDNAEAAGPAPGSAESVRRVRALAGDLVARPLDEPAADQLAAALSDLGGEDRAALRRLASQRRATTAGPRPVADTTAERAEETGNGSHPRSSREQGADRR